MHCPWLRITGIASSGNTTRNRRIALQIPEDTDQTIGPAFLTSSLALSA